MDAAEHPASTAPARRSPMRNRTSLRALAAARRRGLFLTAAVGSAVGSAVMKTLGRDGSETHPGCGEGNAPLLANGQEPCAAQAAAPATATAPPTVTPSPAATVPQRSGLNRLLDFAKTKLWGDPGGGGAGAEEVVASPRVDPPSGGPPCDTFAVGGGSSADGALHEKTAREFAARDSADAVAADENDSHGSREDSDDFADEGRLSNDGIDRAGRFAGGGDKAAVGAKRAHRAAGAARRDRSGGHPLRRCASQPLPPAGSLGPGWLSCDNFRAPVRRRVSVPPLAEALDVCRALVAAGEEPEAGQSALLRVGFPRAHVPHTANPVVRWIAVLSGSGIAAGHLPSPAAAAAFNETARCTVVLASLMHAPGDEDFYDRFALCANPGAAPAEVMQADELHRELQVLQQLAPEDFRHKPLLDLVRRLLHADGRWGRFGEWCDAVLACLTVTHPEIFRRQRRQALRKLRAALSGSQGSGVSVSGVLAAHRRLRTLAKDIAEADAGKEGIASGEQEGTVGKGPRRSVSAESLSSALSTSTESVYFCHQREQRLSGSSGSGLSISPPI